MLWWQLTCERNDWREANDLKTRSCSSASWCYPLMECCSWSDGRQSKHRTKCVGGGADIKPAVSKTMPAVVAPLKSRLALPGRWSADSRAHVLELTLVQRLRSLHRGVRTLRALETKKQSIRRLAPPSGVLPGGNRQSAPKTILCAPFRARTCARSSGRLPTFGEQTAAGNAHLPGAARLAAFRNPQQGQGAAPGCGRHRRNEVR